MRLKLWKFSKRRNSTSFPTSTPLFELEVTLKDGCNILQPSWLIRTSNISHYMQCNYANFEGRYYFLRSPTIVRNDLIQIEGSVDVLATYQQYILAKSAFVERAAVAYDPNLPDNLLSQDTTIAQPRVFTSREIAGWDANGTFIVRTIGGSGAISSTGIRSYCMTAENLSQILNGMFDTGRYDFLSDTSVKSFFNPFQYIVDCKWFPFNSSVFNTAGVGEEITLGWWKSGGYGVPVLNTNIHDSIDVSIPSGIYDDFRRYDSRWSTLRILIPGCGSYFLNPAECDRDIRVEFDIDIATGDGIVKIHPMTQPSATIALYSGRYCSPISIGQLETNTGGLIASTMSVAGSILSGNLLGAAGNMLNVAQHLLQPTPSLNGNSGNISALLNTPRIVVTLVQYNSKEFAVSEVGRPVMATLPLSMFTGFVKCGNVSMLIPGLEEEVQMLNGLMNGGFYIE